MNGGSDWIGSFSTVPASPPMLCETSYAIRQVSSVHKWCLFNVERAGNKALPLPPRFVRDLLHREKQILHHGTAAEIDLGGYQHAG